MAINTEPVLDAGLNISTLVELLQSRGLKQPSRIAYRFFADGESEESQLTYGDLYARACAIATRLQDSEAEGQRALLLYPAGLDYITAFFGCLLAGVIAVPAFPPRVKRNAARLRAMASDAGATIALTTSAQLSRLESFIATTPDFKQLRWLATDEIEVNGGATAWRAPALDSNAPAYLQYTSGSTGQPKGVVVTHANVLHNSAYIHLGFAHTPDSVSLCWLPHFHDMGLLDGIIQPLYGGFPCILMSPTAFLQRPARWLEAISRHRVTHTGGPNFAYDLCVQKVNAETRATLDLSAWDVAYNGAEPVRAETLRRFAEMFAPCGFKSTAFYPAYGLAESTLKVSGGSRGDGAQTLTVRADALEQHRVVLTTPQIDGALTLVGSGQGTFETEAVIVNPETRTRCAPDEVGEIWVKGTGVAAGYWNRFEETAETFQATLADGSGPYLRTGDLGFVHHIEHREHLVHGEHAAHPAHTERAVCVTHSERAGHDELFVTGRLKDLIIIRGRNLYPQDIEASVARCHPALRPMSGAAFAVEVDGVERLVLVQEAEHRGQPDHARLMDAMRESLAEEFEVQPFAILLVKAGSLPKTSSGKMQRNLCREKFLRREFAAVAEWHAASADSAEVETLFTLSPNDAHNFADAAAVESWLRVQLAAMLRTDAVDLETERPLTHYGVDSLMAIELMHNLETRLGVRLSMSDFLSSPSLAELASRAFDELQANASSSTRAASSPQVETRLHPLSHGQQALWFLAQMAPESAAYNVASAVRIKTAPDVTALQRAFQSLVNRHSVLRTTFTAAQGEAAQLVHDGMPINFTVEDASELSEASLQERLSVESQTPFDLTSGSLLRVVLFKRQDGDDDDVLLLVAHHIIVDLWSMGLLMQDLGELYSAETNAAPPTPAPHAADYTKYIYRQRELLDGAAGERLSHFWQKELAGAVPVLRLRTDKPRPAMQTYRGAAETLRLDARLTGQLKNLSRSQHATLYTLLLAAFQNLLYRYTGQEDFSVGTPTSGRDAAEFARTVGYFVNPVVLRARPTGETPFIKFLDEVRRTVLAAFAHQEYPFELLVSKLQPERDPARSPLFQVMFAFNQARLLKDEGLAAFALGEAGAQMELGELTLEAVSLEQRVAQFDLTLAVAETGDELLASLEYNSDLFEAATVKRMLAHFRTLLESIVENPAQPLALLDMLTQDERRQLLVEWNAPLRQEEFAPAFQVQQLFEQQAARTPERVAVVYENQRLTYGELNGRANRLAHYLRACGVGADAPVAICLERSSEIPVAMLGVLKAGGAYVPLDPAYPTERLSFMLADVRASVLLTQQSLLERLPLKDAGRVICLDRDAEEIARQRSDNPVVETFADQLAYIVFTSGSTGQPKGVMVSQRSLSEAYRAWRDIYQLKGVHSILQTVNFSFDVFTADVMRALCGGAKLVMCPKEILFAPDELYELMKREEVDFADFVPPVMRALTVHLEETQQRLETLHTIISGGDTLYVEDQRRLRNVCGSRTRILNSYGITEATIDNTTFENSAVGTATQTADGIIPIGRPFANLQIYLLDDWLQPVPVGVAGQLHIGGNCLARGYLNRPDLTAEKFIPDPFAQELGARLYRSGDLARYLPDGNIVFLGRNDFQVKVRGYRIELGEIEAALRLHTGVREVVVTFADDGRGVQQGLIAYIVGERGEPAPTAHELRDFLKERLVEQMLPSAFVFLDELPRTPNGKVDRRALPAPASTRFETDEGFIAPRTSVEKILARLWAELLKLESVSVHDNFFESGGDSILSIQLVARARQAGINLTPAQIFVHPTIEKLAAASSSSTPSPSINEQGSVSGAVNLTPIQRWFFEQNFAGQDHWNMALMLEGKERLNLALVEKTLAHLHRQHDALRLRFVKEEGGWRQMYGAEAETTHRVRLVDLSGLSLPDQHEVKDSTVARIQSELDLASGDLVRAALFDAGEGEPQHLLVVIHHLVIDAVSWGIVLEDFERIYRQLQRQEIVELPPKTASFKSWAEQLEDFAQGEALRDGLNYWTGLSSHAIAKLPVDVATENQVDVATRNPTDVSAKNAFEGSTKNIEGGSRTHTVRLAAGETRALLQEVGEAYHTQINDLLLTALVKAFQNWTRRGALLVELEGHGREELSAGVDLSRTVGWFTSAFPVYLDLEGAETSGAALKTIKEQLRKIPRRGIGYGLLRYMCADSFVSERMRELPQAEVSFNYLGQLDRVWRASTLFVPSRESTGATRHARAQRSHLIEINAAVVNGELKIDWTFNREIHQDATIEKLAADYIASLRELIAHCLDADAGGFTPSDFPLAALSQPQLDELFRATHDITDVYRLSPMQQGMLFHSLYAPDTGIYTGQFSCVLEGELNAPAFQAAWRQTLARHEILRASFVWENLDEPLQLIHRDASVEFEQHDWRGLGSDEAARIWESRLEDEQRRGFDLSIAPLQSFVLARIADDACRFAWTHHHLLLDGWSGALLLREVFAAYEALRQGTTLAVASARPYRDYIAWLGQQDIARAEDFWRQYLKGFTTPTPLAFERARVKTTGDDNDGAGGDVQHFGERKLCLDQALTARLQAFTRRHQLTLNTLAQGAWAVLLHRYSHERDVVFGATVAGRPATLAGVESMTGLFINTLPVRINVPPQMKVVEWLRRLQSEQVRLREYEHSPLMDVQRWSDVPRETALFESLFVFENYPLDADAVTENLSLKLSDVRSFDRTNYPLTIIALPNREFVLQALYDNQRFDDEAIARLLSHLATLLENFIRQPEQSLDAVELLTERERRQLLVEWNPSARDEPPPQNQRINELFEAQAAATPASVALVFDDERLTYQELNERANKLAHHLQAMGVGAESLVGILIERSTAMVVALLAVLKAGGAYLPLDSAYPQERLAFMLADAGARVLLTQSSLLERLPPHEARVLLLDASRDILNERSNRNPESFAAAENLAYVIYTSGSTGQPKGVGMTHGNAAAFLRWATAQFDRAELSGVLASTSICFDLSIFELFAPLVCGGKVVLVENALAMADAVAAQEVTLLNTVPSAMAELLRLDALPPTVRTINLAGEPLKRSLVKRLFQHQHVERVFNLYGPTEDTTYSTVSLIESHDDSEPTIGQPITGTRAYLLDERLQLIPVGVTGELYLGGAGLARGYLHRPELTAARFIPHPFATRQGERLYRTGDLARRLANGEIEFLGRADHQVKLKGYRIELGEIEALLSGRAAIAEAVVVAVEDAEGDKRLVAYVVAKEGAAGASETVEALRDDLRTSLPEYMIPSAFVFLDKLPLTPNGKIDRKALPAPENMRTLTEVAYVAPRDEVEEALASIWSQLLKVDRVGVFDNFFDLGGHSLLATRLLSSLRKIFRLELSLREVFEAVTIAELADVLVAQEETPGRTLKIARVWKKIKNTAPDELMSELERKRTEKSDYR